MSCNKVCLHANDTSNNAIITRCNGAGRCEPADMCHGEARRERASHLEPVRNALKSRYCLRRSFEHFTPREKKEKDEAISISR